MKTITGPAIKGQAMTFSKERMSASAMATNTTRRQNQIVRLRCCSAASEERRVARRSVYSLSGSLTRFAGVMLGTLMLNMAPGRGPEQMMREDWASRPEYTEL